MHDEIFSFTVYNTYNLFFMNGKITIKYLYFQNLYFNYVIEDKQKMKD